MNQLKKVTNYMLTRVNNNFMLGTIKTLYRSYGSNYKKERGFKNEKIRGK